jgi:hypothetical protein
MVIVRMEIKPITKEEIKRAIKKAEEKLKPHNDALNAVLSLFNGTLKIK